MEVGTSHLLVSLVVESYTSINESVLSVLIAFKGFSADILLSVDQTILVSVMVEVKFSILAINLNKLFPVIANCRALVVFNKLKLIGESPA